MEEKDTNKKSKTRRRLVISAIIILILILLLALLLSDYFKKPKGGEGENPGNIFDLSLDKNASDGDMAKRSRDEIIDALNKQVEEGMMNISMNTNPIFETGTSEGNLIIVNEEANRYPQVVEIYIVDTNELIYKSGGIPVGSKIENATLDYSLSKGTYDCIAYFNAINPDTGKLVGKAGANIKVTINN